MSAIDDIVAQAGPRYSVKLPKKRSDGTFVEGITVTV